MKPTGRRTQNTALAPIHFDNLIAVARLVRAYPGFLRPHEGVSFRAEYQKNRAPRVVVRVVITPHRPLGEVTDQSAAAHIERGDAHAVPLRLGSILDRPASIRAKVRFPFKRAPRNFPLWRRP